MRENWAFQSLRVKHALRPEGVKIKPTYIARDIAPKVMAFSSSSSSTFGKAATERESSLLEKFGLFRAKGSNTP